MSDPRQKIKLDAFIKLISTGSSYRYKIFEFIDIFITRHSQGLFGSMSQK